MYSQIFFRSNILKNCTLGQRKFSQCLSQTFSLPRSTLTRVTRNFCDARFFGASNVNISRLSLHRKCDISENKFSTSAGLFQESLANTNTKVINNVFLYKHERPKFYTFLNIFAVFQFAFWMGIGYVSYTFIPQWKQDEQTIWEYLSEHWIFALSTYLAYVVGFLTTLMLWTFTTKSVKYIILKKGGEMVTFVTYTPFKSKIGFSVPIENINCKTTRKQMANYLPLKVKGHWFYYILDAGGEFTNPRLFDATLALMRFNN